VEYYYEKLEVGEESSSELFPDQVDLNFKKEIKRRSERRSKVLIEVRPNSCLPRAKKGRKI
jgi:hypothetical protein